MFGRKGPPSWITDLESRFWLVNVILAHFEFYGEKQFERKNPIILNQKFHSFNGENPELFLKELTEHLVQESRIEIKKVNIEIFKEEKVEDVLSKLGMEYSVQGRESTLGIFHNIDTFGYANIAIEEHLISNYSRLLGTLCHELGHVFLHLKRPPEDEIWEPEDEEIITDLTTIMLGFGIYTCNSQEQFIKSSDGQYTSWEASVQGYLDLEECCLIQGFLGYHFGQNLKSYNKYLEANPRKFIEESQDFFSNLPEEQFQKEYIDEDETDSG